MFIYIFVCPTAFCFLLWASEKDRCHVTAYCSKSHHKGARTAVEVLTVSLGLRVYQIKLRSSGPGKQEGVRDVGP